MNTHTVLKLDSVNQKLPPFDISSKARGRVTPPTNRGVNSPNISLDWLTVTFPRGSQLKQIQRIAFRFASSALISARDTIRFVPVEGRNCYENGISVRLGDKELGSMLWGGNAGTIMLEAKGVLCGFITRAGLWPRVYKIFGRYNPRITRADLAADFYQGELCVRCANDVYKAAGADFLGIRKGGKIPTHRFIDGGASGSTLEVGSRKSGRQICIYEKGRQLGFFDQIWTRAEVRFRRYRSGFKHYEVPWDILVSANWWNYWSASAEYLAKLAQHATALRVGAASIEYDGFLHYLASSARNCRNQYGGLIGFLSSVLGSVATCRLLSRSSWKGVDLWPGWQDYSIDEIKEALELELD